MEHHKAGSGRALVPMSATSNLVPMGRSSMMMIAFNTIKSSLVPLIEGLCAQIYFRFEISVGLFTSSSLFFCERKHMLKRKQKGTESRLLPVAQHIYIHVYFVHCTVYMYTIITVHLDFFRALQVSRPNTWAHIRVPHMQSLPVCVRVRTHTHTTHTHQPPIKNGETLPSPKQIPHTGKKQQP